MTKIGKRVLPLDAHVGSCIKSQRLALGISQEKLADAVGVTFQQVQKYEKGVNRVSASRLQQIADVLAVSPGFFFEGAPGVAKHSGRIPFRAILADIAELVSSEDGRALAKAFAQITDAKVRRSIVTLVERLAGD